MILCFCGLALKGQPEAHVIDSLFQVFRKENGSTQIEAANRLCRLFKEHEYLDTLYQFNASTIGVMPFHVLNGMSSYYFETDQYSKALECGKQALKRYTPQIDNESYASCLFSLSVICQRMGNPYEAIKYQKMCYEMDLKSGNRENISSSLHSLATLFLAAKQPTEALDFANKAIAKVNAHTGVITGVKAGKTTVYATTHNGIEKSVSVTVKAAPTKVTVSPAKLNLSVGMKAGLHP